jgi:hypothetical protein
MDREMIDLAIFHPVRSVSLSREKDSSKLAKKGSPAADLPVRAKARWIPKNAPIADPSDGVQHPVSDRLWDLG